MTGSSPNLCCILNPKGQCRNCGAGICKEHIQEELDKEIRTGTLSHGRPHCYYCKWKFTIYDYPLHFTIYEGWSGPHRRVVISTFPAPYKPSGGQYEDYHF